MAAEVLKDQAKTKGGTKPVLLVVEDDANMRELIVNVLGPIEADIVALKNGQYALDYLECEEVAVVVTDLRMPGVDGIEVLNFARKCNPMVQVVLITGHATVESAVEALKNGAFDYLRKPFEPDELCYTVQRALEHYMLNKENLRLRATQQIYHEGSEIIGRSEPIRRVCNLVSATAGYDCCVLITGESGSGKELVAKQIYIQSSRKDKRFVALNCAAIPENIIESELFGHQKGAFTGADRAKPGLFEVADGGTLFLDEINNASPSLQAKLLRVLQDGTFFRIGDTEPRNTDVRLIAASNKDFSQLIEEGTFRDDLYYRLNVIEINIPPLRDRREDIPLLANFFINKNANKLGKKVKGMTTSVLGALIRYDWPGNVRELENLIQRMIILTESDVIDVDVLPPELSESSSRKKALDYISPQSLEEIEAYFVAKTLRETNGNRSLAAEILGIDKSTLWRKIKRYKLDD